MPAPVAQQWMIGAAACICLRAKKRPRHGRGCGSKDTEMPPIERVQGPDIKGMRLLRELPIKRRRGWKSTGTDKKNQLKQQFRIILNYNCQL
jgi:hypothetical protein